MYIFSLALGAVKIVQTIKKALVLHHVSVNYCFGLWPLCLTVYKRKYWFKMVAILKSLALLNSATPEKMCLKDAGN